MERESIYKPFIPYSLNRVGVIQNEHDFFQEINKLNEYCNIKRVSKTAEFHDMAIRLLSYTKQTENATLTLKLSEVLNRIQELNKFDFTGNATNVHQLCDMLLIQFGHSKAEIYNNLMKLLNYYSSSTGKHNIKDILSRRIVECERNIFECYNFPLVIQLLHTYLMIDTDKISDLYLNILKDWDKFGKQVNEEDYMKFLWYGFALENDRLLKKRDKQQYKRIIRSGLWQTKFYRFIHKNLNGDREIDIAKVNRTISRFLKMKTYSSSEKELITKKIISEIVNKIDEHPNIVENNKVTKKVLKLIPSNIPQGLFEKDISEHIIIQLAVYRDEKMNVIQKIVTVGAKTDIKKSIVYVDKYAIRKIKKESKQGYVCIIDKLKDYPEAEKLFKWPSTEIEGTGTEANSYGLNELSEIRKMGYQITNSTREQRWEVLQQAVPQVGLKKVAYTIAGNVKLRKGQKNGQEKFSYAISEWEHDLAKLKKKYYKKDFNWPKT